MTRWSAAAILVCIGVVLSATLTPVKGAIEGTAVGTGRCDVSRVALPSLDQLAAVADNDTLVNVLMFVPLGFAVASARRSPRTAGLVLVVVTLPLLIEAAQLAAPILARSCEVADVIDNVTGLLVGLVAGTIAAWVAKAGVTR